MSKSFFKQIAIPLFFLAFAITSYVIWKILQLPSEADLIEIARGYFNKYGLITLLISSLIEGLLLMGWYYPGSLVIFLGVIFAGKDVIKVIEAVAIITVGLFTAYIINFFLGKYGWYKLLLTVGLRKSLEVAKQKLTKYGLWAIFISYWHPNLAALTSTATGILQFSFKKFIFYSFGATVLWNIFWGTLVYLLGEASLSLIGIRFIIIVLTAWIVYKLWARNKSVSKKTYVKT
jgi:membrane protein DedA with SNARE-associated domain